MRQACFSLFRSGVFALLALTLGACGGGSGGGSSGTPILMGGAIQGNALRLTKAVTTLAGTPKTLVDGIGTAAKFGTNYAVATDGTSLYVCDYSLRKVNLSTGEVTTLTTSITGPMGAVVVGGHLYVTGNNAVFDVDPTTGAATVLAGVVGVSGYVDAKGAAAYFNSPAAITSDGTHLFVGDNYAAVRTIDIATGVVTTLAGDQSQGGFVDATGTNARFGYISGLVYRAGAIYVSDANNLRIRRIDPVSGDVTTFSGSGSQGLADADAANATFYSPMSIATDGTALYVGDYSRVRAVDASGAVTTLAGSAQAGYANGVGTAARFQYARGMASVGSTIYIGDQYDDAGKSLVRRLDLGTGAVTTFAGVVPGADGLGTAVNISPRKIATDGTDVYVTDGFGTIRKAVIATGEVTTLAGTATVFGNQDATGAAASFAYPGGITTDGTNLYVTDCINNNIRQVAIATREVTTLAGGSAGTAGFQDGSGTNALFNCPWGITTDGTSLYVADYNNNAIRSIDIATGQVTTLAGDGIAGYLDAKGTAAEFYYPEGLTTDGTHLYVVEDGLMVRKIVIATGVVTTLAGQNGIYGNTDGPGNVATFGAPYDITSDGTYLYVADSSANSIRRVTIATGYVTTLAGSATMASGFVDGTGSAARFDGPSGITTDGKRLFVSDGLNRALRVLQ